ncbi:MAG: hypothetical protein ABI687_01615 [Flavitalea sp.]
MARKIIYLLFLLFSGIYGFAQKIDSIYFNLYTDSLKKGTFNYINVDGKCADGRWLPLTSKELTLTASVGKFSGNSLYVDSAFRGDNITVKAMLINNPASAKEITIYIKKNEALERLKTMEEVMQKPIKVSSGRRTRKNNP